jgi:glycosyltransferase involved in cell wall biosynthesis
MAEVSVITSARNEGGFLLQSMETLRRQSLRDWEWVVVDDGSTDSTWGILSSAAKEDQRIRPIRNLNSQGLSRALNMAVSKSRGRYIARLDADDFCHPSRLTKQVEVLHENPHIGLVASDNHVVDEGGRLLETWRFMHTPEEIYYTLNFHNCICHSSVMFRRELFDRVGGYREDLELAQDYELWLKMSKQCAMYKIPEALVSWRKRPNGASIAKRTSQSETAGMVALENLRNLIGEDFPSHYLKVVLGRHFCMDDDDVKGFFRWLSKIHRALEQNAPTGVDREKLRQRCKQTVEVISLAVMWKRGPLGSLSAAALAMVRPRIIKGLWNQLRRGRWRVD